MTLFSQRWTGRRAGIWILLPLTLISPVTALTAPESPSFFIGNPMPFFEETDTLVKRQFPAARLLFVSTFALSNPDPQCSQIGWQFVYQDSRRQVGIRRSFRHLSGSDGICRYVPDSTLAVSSEDFPIAGYMFLEGRLAQVRVPFDDASRLAMHAAGNGFYSWWAALVTPLHPKAAGRVFWRFRGPVACDKGATILIDAENGAVEPYFSEVPTCP